MTAISGNALVSTAADSPEDDSDYTVQRAQDKLKRKIFLRKMLICICVFSLIFVIAAAIAVGVLYGATDLFKNKNQQNAEIKHSSPSSAHVSTSFTISSTPVSSIPTPTPSPTGKASSIIVPTPTPSPTASPPSSMNNSKVLDYIDTSFDPCEDFYNYSCGLWRSTRPYAAEWGTFLQLELDNYNKLAGYLSLYVRSHDPEAVKKAKYIYSACTDTYYIKENLVDQLDGFMDKAGGWEKGDFYPYNSWSINNNLYQDHYLGSSAFFSFGISPDDLNSSKQIIRVKSTIKYRCDVVMY